MTHIEIDEVISRSEQGVTQPYICRSSDGNLYYVKGRNAGYPSLMKEWIAGRLAVSFGLPVPPFAILSMPRELYEAGRDSWLSDMGYGLMFGSQAQFDVNEISISDLDNTSASLMRDIAVFDWWILNGDRTLSINGGNPNILWSIPLKRPFVIDHNLAFDYSVTLGALEKEHIFGSTLAEVKSTPELQASYAARFTACLSQWTDICDELPERWHYIDDRLTIETDFSIERAHESLLRFERSSIWQ